MANHNFQELKVWHKAMELVKNVYGLSANFPDDEKYNLGQQVKRCAVSIPSNIAEGSGRSTDKSFVQFLSIAQGSCYELQTQLIICKELNFIKEVEFEQINETVREVAKMINGFSNKLKSDVLSLKS